MKTVIIDNEWLIREELIQLLKAFKNIRIAGEATNMSDGLKLINEVNPDLVFLDMYLKGAYGLLKEYNNFKIVLLSVFEENKIENAAYKCDGCLYKPINATKLFEIIQDLKYQ